MSTVKISELPPSIQSKIPMSIKAYKDEYEVSTLPYDIQYLIDSYLEEQKTVTYDLVLDCKPTLSAYGDFTTIDNVHDLVIEYLKHWFLIRTKTYPFDATISCDLPRYISTLDTDVKNLFISNEIGNIIRILTNDINVDISITNFNFSKSAVNLDIEYIVKMTVKVNNVAKDVSLSLR